MTFWPRMTRICLAMRAVTTSAAASVFFVMMFSRYRYFLNCPTTTPNISALPPHV